MIIALITIRFRRFKKVRPPNVKAPPKESNRITLRLFRKIKWKENMLSSLRSKRGEKIGVSIYIVMP